MSSSGSMSTVLAFGNIRTVIYIYIYIWTDMNRYVQYIELFLHGCSKLIMKCSFDDLFEWMCCSNLLSVSRLEKGSLNSDMDCHMFDDWCAFSCRPFWNWGERHRLRNWILYAKTKSRAVSGRGRFRLLLCFAAIAGHCHHFLLSRERAWQWEKIL